MTANAGETLSNLHIQNFYLAADILSITGTRVAPDYTGYVHLIVGAEDKVFCGTGINNAYDVNGDCTPNGHNIPAEYVAATLLLLALAEHTHNQERLLLPSGEAL